MADKFVNRAFAQVIESAANTLTFSQISSAIAFFEKKAWLVHRIEWYTGDRSHMAAAVDYIQGALTTSNKMTGLSLDDPAVVDLFVIQHIQAGTPGNFVQVLAPIVRDFSTLPMGGLIIPGTPIFLAVEGVSLSSPITLSARIFFTHIDLKADEYIELVDALRMVE